MKTGSKIRSIYKCIRTHQQVLPFYQCFWFSKKKFVTRSIFHCPVQLECVSGISRKNLTFIFQDSTNLDFNIVFTCSDSEAKQANMEGFSMFYYWMTGDEIQGRETRLLAISRHSEIWTPWGCLSTCIIRWIILLIGLSSQMQPAALLYKSHIAMIGTKSFTSMRYNNTEHGRPKIFNGHEMNVFRFCTFEQLQSTPYSLMMFCHMVCDCDLHDIGKRTNIKNVRQHTALLGFETAFGIHLLNL